MVERKRRRIEDKWRRGWRRWDKYVLFCWRFIVVVVVVVPIFLGCFLLSLFSSYLILVFLVYGDQEITQRHYTSPSSLGVWTEEGGGGGVEGGIIDVDIRFFFYFFFYYSHSYLIFFCFFFDRLKDIPPETRICFTLFAARIKMKGGWKGKRHSQRYYRAR